VRWLFERAGSMPLTGALALTAVVAALPAVRAVTAVTAAPAVVAAAPAAVAAATPGAASAGAQTPGPASGAAATPVPDVLARAEGLRLAPLPRAAQLYALNCQGCHGEAGVSVPEVPPLAHRVGYFARLPAGRRYLVEVPNVALNPASDADLALLLNWLLATFSRAELPADFRPYSAPEVGALRRVRIDPAVRRRQVVAALVAARRIPSADTLALVPAGLY